MRIICFGCSNTYGTGLDNPSVEAWPSVLQTLVNTETINLGKPGASNLEILNNILKFDFKDDDKVIVMWAPLSRDYLFDPEQQIGSWNKSELRDHWLHVHTIKDLAIRSWIYIHHAYCYFKARGLEQLNIAVTYEDLNEFKPSYIDGMILTDIELNRIKYFGDKAQDNKHPGIKTHIEIANTVSKLI